MTIPRTAVRVLHLATMKQDGTVIDTVELPMWKEGEAPATPAPAQDGEDPVDTPADGADGSEAMPLTEQETSTSILRQRICMW